MLDRSSHAALAKNGGALWAVLVLVVLFAPLIPLTALGGMRKAMLAAWTATAVALLALLAWYDVGRALPPGGSDPGAAGPSQAAFFGAGIVLYVLHHLIEAADVARSWRAAYHAYVEVSWRHGVQLALAAAFAGVAWGVLQLGDALLLAIGVHLPASDTVLAALTGLAFGFAFA